MEGVGGIGTSEMTRAKGKDYNLGRKLMTDEVNAVVSAIYQYNSSAEIIVNDSHGDMQNLNHQDLDPKVVYIQGNKKPYGMVQGLDKSFDGAIFLGLESPVVKSHGGTDSVGFAHSINVCNKIVKANLIKKIESNLITVDA